MSGASKNGHGVGLSQKGAIYAAKNGIDCTEILSFYYPGTEIVSDYGDKDIEYQRKVLEEVKVRVKTALETLKKGLE